MYLRQFECPWSISTMLFGDLSFSKVDKFGWKFE